MISVLILYYSSYGHIEEMANAVATGVLEGVGRPIIKRVPELVRAFPRQARGPYREPAHGVDVRRQLHVATQVPGAAA